MKIILAYSGGLDTSVILRWLKDNYRAQIVAFCADIGQEEELAGLEEKALKTGASKYVIEDLQEEFARDFIFPMFQAGAIYEGQYLLGTSIARPLIAKRMIEIARKEKADVIAHSMSVVAVQAAAADAYLDRDTGQSREHLCAVRQAARCRDTRGRRMHQPHPAAREDQEGLVGRRVALVAHVLEKEPRELRALLPEAVVARRRNRYVRQDLFVYRSFDQRLRHLRALGDDRRATWSRPDEPIGRRLLPPVQHVDVLGIDRPAGGFAPGRDRRMSREVRIWDGGRVS